MGNALMFLLGVVACLIVSVALKTNDAKKENFLKWKVCMQENLDRADACEICDLKYNPEGYDFKLDVGASMTDVIN